MAPCCLGLIQQCLVAGRATSRCRSPCLCFPYLQRGREPLGDTSGAGPPEPAKGQLPPPALLSLSPQHHPECSGETLWGAGGLRVLTKREGNTNCRRISAEKIIFSEDGADSRGRHRLVAATKPGLAAGAVVSIHLLLLFPCQVLWGCREVFWGPGVARSRAASPEAWQLSVLNENESRARGIGSFSHPEAEAEKGNLKLAKNRAF